MFLLHGAVQSYQWGKTGHDSLVAQLKKGGSKHFLIENGHPYAELWMGTHPSGPAIINDPNNEAYNGKLLQNWLYENPESLGDGKELHTSLPFLLKVLSIKKALSIQAHPNKKHAEELHEKYPDLYKDPNHKPEMAIALTEFQALCGFRPILEIKQVFRDNIELVDVIGKQIVEPFLSDNGSVKMKKLLQDVFRALMSCPPSCYKPQIANLMERLKTKTKREPHEDLFLKINDEFPDDIGCLGLFFFNFLTLEPGQAIFLAANEPHAYISGDCVECMACSDNVVRAGLTPKHKDVETLCEMLTYETKSAQDNIFQGTQEEPNIILFKPSVPDFCLAHITIPIGTLAKCVPKRKTASIILVVDGNATIKCIKQQSTLEILPGSIIFVSADLELEITSQLSSLSIFQAFSDVCL